MAKITNDQAKEIIANNYNVENITRSQTNDLAKLFGMTYGDIIELIDQIKDSREISLHTEEVYIPQFNTNLNIINALRPQIEKLRSETAKNLKKGDKPPTPKKITQYIVSQPIAPYVKDEKDIKHEENV